MKTAAFISTMNAEQGTSATALRASPASEHTTDIAIASSIMGVKRRVNTSAVIMGIDIMAISSITPTRRIVSTMHIATSTVMV